MTANEIIQTIFLSALALGLGWAGMGAYRRKGHY